MKAKIVKAPGGATTITPLQIFAVIWKDITKIEGRTDFCKEEKFPLPVTIEADWDHRDLGSLAHAGYDVEEVLNR